MNLESIINKVIHGDCIKIMSSIPDNSVEMILTDIPYDVVNRESAGIRVFDKKDADDLTFDLDDFIKECVRITNGSIYIFCSTEQVSHLRKSLIRHGLTTRLGIWEKTNPSPVNGQYLWLSGIECCVFGRKKGAVFNEHCKNTVWRFPNGRSKLHKTEKPLSLFEYLIGVSSNQGDLVLDTCLGSGTTALAAKKLGRNFIGIELNKEYVDIANERLSNETSLS